MLGVLRHSGNVHLGMWNRNLRFRYLGVMFDNIKASYIFTGIKTSISSVIGLIKNVKL